MKNLTKTILRYLAGFAVAEIWAVRTCTLCARAMFLKVYNLPGFAHARALGNLKVLREVCDILDSLDLVNFVVGGFAYDISAGKITRYHKDLDVAFLDDGDMARIYEAFTRRGFEIVALGLNGKVRKHGVMVDVLGYRTSGDGYIITRFKDMLIRMPKEIFFSYNTKWFYGNAYRVASDEHNVCIEPFVHEKGSLKYIAELKKKSTITCRKSREQIVDTVTVYEYHDQGTGHSMCQHIDAARQYRKCG